MDRGTYYEQKKKYKQSYWTWMICGWIVYFGTWWTIIGIYIGYRMVGKAADYKEKRKELDREWEEYQDNKNSDSNQNSDLSSFA